MSRCFVCKNEYLHERTFDLTGFHVPISRICSDACWEVFKVDHVNRCTCCGKVTPHAYSVKKWSEDARSKCEECQKLRKCENCGNEFKADGVTSYTGQCQACVAQEDREAMAEKFMDTISIPTYRHTVEGKLKDNRGLRRLRLWAHETKDQSGCFVSGKTGTGKTRSSILIAREMLLKGVCKGARFINGPELTMISNSEWSDEIDELKRVDFLILDEVDKVARSGKCVVDLYNLIDHRLGRLDELKTYTVLIANMSVEDWVKSFDLKSGIEIEEPLARRIKEFCCQIPFYPPKAVGQI